MKVVTLKGFGARDVLQIEAIPKPKPQANELLIKVFAASINRADILQRKGKYPPPSGSSEILGLDIAGEIVEVGEHVSGWSVGEPVFGLVSGGGYTEYCCIDAEMAIKKPDSLSYIEAAAIPEVFITAQETLLELGQLKNEQRVLIHAGGSGVGLAAIQLAKIINAEIFATAGHEQKIDKLNKIGIKEVFNYKSESFIERIFEKTNGVGVDVIIDFTGARFFQEHLRLLKQDGRLLLLALMGGGSNRN